MYQLYLIFHKDHYRPYRCGISGPTRYLHLIFIQIVHSLQNIIIHHNCGLNSYYNKRGTVALSPLILFISSVYSYTIIVFHLQIKSIQIHRSTVYPVHILGQCPFICFTKYIILYNNI